jgi:two-component system, cell cycle sensor histidine kinase and response regulator CckA
VESVADGGGFLPLGEALRLPPAERNLEFTFAVPTFQAPGELRVRYRLEGWDAEWIDAGASRVARYTNLPPRGYTFRVEVANRRGEWVGNEAAAALELVPRFHERGLVRAGVVLLLLLAGALVYRRRIRRMELREARLLRLVDEREEATAALTRSEERLRLALEAGRLGTWEWDLDRDEVTWSEAVNRFFGPGPVSGAEFRDRLEARLPAPDASTATALLDEVRAGDRVEFATDFEVRDNGPSPLQVQLRGRRIDGAPADPPRVLGVAADVTALIRAQQELRAREEELRHALKMEAVGSLAGGVAHDFNNLLAVISMNARLALESIEPDTPAHEEITATVRAADRASELTRQLLAFSRKQILQPRPLHLNESVQTVERMLRRLLRTNVALETDLAPDLAPVLADEGGVEQILVNLLVNAQDAMPQGGRVLIRTRNVAGDPRAPVDDLLAGDHVLLSVEDTGKGMDAETLERIFEPFFTTKDVGEGTGLGLASVYGLVQQTGGRVEVESTPGAGAVFSVRFPVAASSA